MPETALRAIHQIIGCDAAGIGETDQTGYRLRGMNFPSVDLGDPQVCDGPLPIGLMHDADHPESDRDAPELGLCDLIRLGFKTGHGTVVQFYFSRRREMFTERELALLTMVEPAVGRLVRGGAGSQRAGTLSASERRVLTMVAQGASNREVAEELYVTVHTVRRHLENVYRKLGVTNRTAAALQLRARLLSVEALRTYAIWRMFGSNGL
ncbi:MAG: helix-turn-helix transcriptional regulator [Cryobacterium sp.]|nr:helix-turn-helix transcriptional regulator [Cryobacterium sp.]